MFEFKAKEVILDYNMYNRTNENKTYTTESFLSVGRTNSFENGAFALDESVQYGVFTVAKISKAHIVGRYHVRIGFSVYSYNNNKL